MSVTKITVTVHCDGAFHEPEELRFSDRALKSDIEAKLRSLGWRISRTGNTFCPRHRKPVF
jgi:hypothetical protein